MGGQTVWDEVRVSLGPDAEITGRLSFVEPTRVEGKLKGEVRAANLLVVGTSGRGARHGARRSGWW